MNVKNSPSTVSEPIVSVMVPERIAEFLTDLKPDDADFIHMMLTDEVFKPLTDLLGGPSVLENKLNWTGGAAHQLCVTFKLRI